ncbi:MAG: protein-export membrane protein SecD [Spirochaetes bacterium GWF1_41_5]|nr:MAG: protein-export membrane protein SecD [Spirochaetes bacterium GWF1_41_5]HBE03233.1 protein translocase subunit SecD [Spirochaetia bacterium]
MSKSFRLFVIAGILITGLVFLLPTIRWYFIIPDENKKLLDLGIEEWTRRGYNPDKITELKDLIVYRSKVVSLGLDIVGGIHVVLEADFDKFAGKLGKKPDEITEDERKEAIERILQKLRNRIDQFGVSEPNIRRQGKDRIVIQLPGEKDTYRIRKIIETEGELEFRMVDDDLTSRLEIDTESKKVLNADKIPADYEVKYVYKKNDAGNPEPYYPVVVQKDAVMKGTSIKSASVGYGEFNDHIIRFELDFRGAKIFSDVTGTNQGKALAIILDGKVQSAPRINERISGGSGQITGSFTPEEAKDLALILKAGSLPVPIAIIEEEMIGPSMGRDLLQKSIKALLAGILLVIVFMLIFYRSSGLIASIALLLNGFLIIAVLAPLQFTITLPGIAGLILTMGMAIDANVVIFERIKEELTDNQRTIFEAWERGYDKAFWSIFDSNITTLIAAFILSSYGTGPIKGFAVTLFIGIIISMFTALFVTRYIFDMLFHFNIFRRYSKIII